MVENKYLVNNKIIVVYPKRFTIMWGGGGGSQAHNSHKQETLYSTSY